MKEYSIVAVLWEDHAKVDRSSLPKNPDAAVETTLSIGIIAKETEKTLVLVSDIERYDDRDDCTYLILYKAAILSTKVYGKIKLRTIKG